MADTSIYNRLFQSNPVGAFVSGQKAGSDIQNALLQREVTQQQMEANKTKLSAYNEDLEAQKDLIGITRVKAFMDNQDMESARKFLVNRIKQQRDLGDNELDFEESVIADIDNGLIDSAMEKIGTMHKIVSDEWAIRKGDGAGGANKFQFGGQVTFKDSEGNLYFGSTKKDPSTGQMESALTPIGNAPDTPVGDVEVTGSYGFTGQEKIESSAEQKRLEGVSTFQQKQSELAFSNSTSLAKQIGTLEDALQAVRDGADSGALEKFLPTLQENTARLEQAANKLGIEAINSATFGALSEKELALAMQTGIPLNLDGAELEKFLIDKIDATTKLRREMDRMALFLSKKGNTVEKWIKAQGGASGENMSEEDEFNALMKDL